MWLAPMLPLQEDHQEDSEFDLRFVAAETQNMAGEDVGCEGIQS